MTTIKEDYVSFEIAKLLKEKGFDGFCERFYDYYPETGEVHICGCDEHNNSRYDDEFSMPTLQMAMKWLRIEHNIHIEPHIVKTKYSYGYLPNYIDLKELKQHFPFDEFDFSNADKYACITYDKACEVTIKYCLEKLI